MMRNIWSALVAVLLVGPAVPAFADDTAAEAKKAGAAATAAGEKAEQAGEKAEQAGEKAEEGGEKAQRSMDAKHEKHKSIIGHHLM